METPNEYERDLKYLTNTFSKSKFPVMEKLINIALVTPTPDDLFGYASDPGVRIDVEQCILIDQA